MLQQTCKTDRPSVDQIGVPARVWFKPQSARRSLLRLRRKVKLLWAHSDTRTAGKEDQALQLCELGESALRLMLDRLDRPKMPARDVLLDCTLVLRQSCGA